MTPPVSKSDAHRALVLAEVCQGSHEHLLPEVSRRARDVEVLSRGLKALRGAGGELDCLDAGAPFRFLVTQAALRPGHAWRFTGTPRLAQRPQQPLFQALSRALGTTFEQGAEPWPLTVHSRDIPAAADFAVSTAESSQFASSLLLGCARLVQAGGRPCSVVIDAEPDSPGYLGLTLGWLQRFGFELHLTDVRFTVLSRQGTGQLLTLPGDWSSLTYLLALSWCSGVGVSGVDLEVMHPDRLFVTHLASVGLQLQQAGEVATVEGTPRGGLQVEASACPDAVPALVALALRCPRPSVFNRCGVLRLKESDRLAGVAALAEAFGGRATVSHERLTIEPPRKARPARFDGQEDHRLVMAAATAGRLLEVDVDIRGTSAVEKSFPGFWDETGKAGVVRREAA